LALIALAGALAVTGCQATDSLAGPTWQWAAQQETSPAGEPVAPDPESYTIEFLLDGTVNVKADCNDLTGTYTVGVPLDLAIDLDSSTLAACGDSSLDRVYLESLGRISSYSTGSGELKLFFADDAGAMQFTSPRT
jgi:heat shock protein HslJ